jgi:hypothetical protein
MVKLFLTIDTASRGKLVLLELPFSTYACHYLSTKFSAKSSKLEPMRKTSIEILGLSKLQQLDIYDLLSKIFTFEKGGTFVYDIIIKENRYICYPMWIDSSRYIKEPDENRLDLKMFNIILCIDRKEYNNVTHIYNTLQVFSNNILYEEYRTRYLEKEICDILDLYEEYFNADSIEVNFQDMLDSFDHRNNLLRCMRYLYMGLGCNKIFKVRINNWLEFRNSVYLEESTCFEINEIKPYHSIYITNIAALKDNTNDNNPMLLLFLTKNNPYKSIEEICIENSLSIDTVVKYCRQIAAWGFGRIIYKITGNSIFSIFPTYEYNRKKEKRFIELFGIDLYETINMFLNNLSLEEIYDQLHGSLTIDKFKFMTVYLLENEYIIQNKEYIIPKLPLKYKYNVEVMLLNKSKMTLMENSLFDFMIEDYDIQNVTFKKQTYFEDYLTKLRKNACDDYNILKNIFYLFGNKHCLAEIAYFTGYKIPRILDLIKKYFYLFDIILEPYIN